MTNKDRQKSLDKTKWLASEIAGQDLSGKMECCYHCEHQADKHNFYTYCTKAHAQRVEHCYCAKAYNRMVRGRQNGRNN